MTSKKRYVLRDLVDSVETWNPTRNDPEDSFLYIDLGAVDQDLKQIVGAREISCGEAPSRARQLVQEDDVLVSTVRPNLNGVAKVPEDLQGATASTGFCVLRAHPDVLDSGYLFHWVKTPEFVAEMVRQATGASYPAVSDRIVLNSTISLPQLSEQRRVAAILDHVDALRAERRKALAHVDGLLQSIFIDMFGDPRLNTRGYPTRALKELVEEDRGVTYGIVQRGDDVDDGVPVLRIGDFVDGMVKFGSLKKTSSEISGRYKRTILKGGEIVISIRGTIGRCAVVPKELAGGNISREVALIPLKNRRLAPFIVTLLRTPTIQKRIIGEVKGVAQSGINLEDLRELEIVFPEPSLVSRFCDAYSLHEDLYNRQKESLTQIATLFKSLQHRAFQGEP